MTAKYMWSQFQWPIRKLFAIRNTGSLYLSGVESNYYDLLLFLERKSFIKQLIIFNCWQIRVTYD